MLMPKRTKHRKMQKGRMKGPAGRGTEIEFGDFAIKALEPAWMSTFWPSHSSPSQYSAWKAVRNTSGMAAASSKESALGMGMAILAGIAAYSA